jgi:VanZ family protein
LRTSSSLRTWLPVAFWLGVIALESMVGSSANTGSILERVAHWLFGNFSQSRFDLVHHIIRKTGHFLGYGILGYLWLRAFTRSLDHTSRLKCALLAIICTFVVASLDEWHQSFSPGRTATFRDVLLDTSGALVLISLAMLTFARRPQQRAASRA